MGTLRQSPEVKALAKNPKVSFDDRRQRVHPPSKVLLIRGTARLETVNGIGAPSTLWPPSATSAANREKPDGPTAHPGFKHMVRITITPGKQRVGLLDFQTRFPSAISA